MRLRAATYNVKNTDGGKSLNGIAEELRCVEADIIGLQELDRGVGRSGNADLLKELSEKSGYQNARFCRSIYFGGGEYGTGILTPHPILDSRVKKLPSAEETRILTRFHIDVNGTIICFYNAHLSLEAECRAIQLKEIADEFVGGKLSVLAGDFNIDSFDELKLFEGCNIANFEGHSYNTFKTGGKIDNIITTPDIDIISVFLSESEYSDHNMLVADLEIM
ncbi:MAG: hypothetical protein E7619_10345 [Ruminococcaceae bacterium]|nr:hypothetical protein [Oscillospiraceae bacterium]